MRPHLVLWQIILHTFLIVFSRSCLDTWERQIDNFNAWPALNDSLANISTKLFTSPDNRYVLSLCADPTNKVHTDVKGGVWDGVGKILVGKSESAFLEYKVGNSWAAYHSGKAHSCVDNHNRINVSSNHTSAIVFTCDPTATDPKFSALSPDDNFKCVHFFVLTAKQFCGLSSATMPDKSSPSPTVVTASPAAGPHSEPGSQTTGAGSETSAHKNHGHSVAVLFLILLILVLLYFVLGFTYKRYVEGARGVAQIPNYLFWIRLVRAIQMPFITTSSSSSGRYGNATWRQPPDDFRYDQPPLLTANDDFDDDSGNQNGSPLGVVVERRGDGRRQVERLGRPSGAVIGSAGMDRRHPQGTTDEETQDDSDVRLLAV